ncbi:MAG TPA: hypothetical protein VML55_23860 [Planctomycetaceae bacterium]|nr:hypothetical protein [Planctomycetaceae bacterium]
MNDSPVDPQAELDDEYEEITSDEVDRVIVELESLMATVESENIRSYLEEAAASIYYLIYEDEDLEGGLSAEAA